MAKIFYSEKEAATKLKATPEQMKQLVSSGELRQFRDAGTVHYKVEDVNDLADSDILKVLDSANCKDVAELKNEVKKHHQREQLKRITDAVHQIERLSVAITLIIVIGAFCCLALILLGAMQ